MSHFLLKWGVPKGWELDNDRHARAISLLQEYYDLGESMSAMLQPNTDAHKLKLCEVIDALTDDVEIESDWTGERFTKESAKKYVMEYDK